MLNNFSERSREAERFLFNRTRTCKVATLAVEFRNGVGSIPIKGNSTSIGEWDV